MALRSSSDTETETGESGMEGARPARLATRHRHDVYHKSSLSTRGEMGERGREGTRPARRGGTSNTTSARRTTPESAAPRTLRTGSGFGRQGLGAVAPRRARI